MQTDVAGLPNAAGGAHDLSSQMATLQTIAHVQTEALQKWFALWQEMWVRAVAARNPVELASLPSLVLPELASQVMLYCKQLSEFAPSPMTTDAPDRSVTASGIDVSAATGGTRNQTNQTSQAGRRAVRSLPVHGE